MLLFCCENGVSSSRFVSDVGNVVPIVVSVAMNGTRFMVYPKVQATLMNRIYGHQNKTCFVVNVISGATSGVISAFVASPFNLLKTRMQSSQHAYTGIYNGMKAQLQSRGLRGMFHGVSSAMLRTGVGSAVQLATYDQIKSILVSNWNLDSKSVATHLLSSMTSGFFVCVIMSPFDVVNTRMYNQKRDKDGKGLLYRNLGDCFKKIYRFEGIFAFHKGFAALYVRTAPHTIVTFVAIEFFRKQFARFREINLDTE